MASSMERRLERLEELNATDTTSSLPPAELEERRDLIASLERAKERARREAAAGDSRRLRAIEDLERRMRERVELRRRHGES